MIWNLFLDKYKDGKEYLIDTEMRKNATWGTELEIIAMATMGKERHNSLKPHWLPQIPESFCTRKVN